MRRLLNIPGITFALFFLWKVTLLMFTAQPVPSNDAFFYDGAVVNHLLHVEYCNPSLAQVLPISGTKVFSAYPPLYQAVLLGWMKVFGTGVLASLWLHVCLLGIFSLATLTILVRLELPAAAINVAGLFLFGITFNDRPDTLAHVLGVLSLLALVRALDWPAAAFLLLTFATSLQIGGIYSLWLLGLTIGNCWANRAKLPWAQALTLAATLIVMIALVKYGHPLWWSGFLEHVRITPSVTGLRVPQVEELLKILRTTPGIALVVIGLGSIALRGGGLRAQIESTPALRFVGAGALAALALVFGCLFLLTPNTIHIAGYLQPVLVGGFLGSVAVVPEQAKTKRILTSLFLGAALLVSIRALGMTTWGVWCAYDVSRTQALAQVNRELDATPASSTVFISSAYLYEAAHRTNVTWLHSDWPAPAVGNDWELRAIEQLKPARLLLTQFDYYRHYEPVVAQLRRQRPAVGVRIINLARVPPPDAIPAMRKVVQHISWAPVVVVFSWPEANQTK